MRRRPMFTFVAVTCVLALFGAGAAAASTTKTYATTSFGVTQNAKLTYNTKNSSQCVRSGGITSYQLVSLEIWYTRTNSDRKIDATPDDDRPHWVAHASGQRCDGTYAQYTDSGWYNPVEFGGDNKTERVTWQQLADPTRGAFPFVNKNVPVGFDVAVGFKLCARVLDRSSGDFIGQLQTEKWFYQTGSIGCPGPGV